MPRKRRVTKAAGRSTNTKDWRDLEQLVANIQRSLAPAAKVEHNVKVRGRSSEVDRQIDVLVTQNIGQYTITIAIDCKDYKKPIDVKGVEEFSGMVADIGANKGVLVCPAGFTDTAKTVAKKLQIELYRPVDTGDHKWRVRPKIPVVFEYVEAAIAFQVSCTAAKPFRLSVHPAELQVYSGAGELLGRTLDVAIDKWNNGRYPTEAGRHEGLPIFDAEIIQIDNGYGELIPVQLTAHLNVSVRCYFGQIQVDRMSGFLDEQTGLTHTNSFVVGAIEPSEIESEWSLLDGDQRPPINPVLHLRGLVGWEASQ